MSKRNRKKKQQAVAATAPAADSHVMDAAGSVVATQRVIRVGRPKGAKSEPADTVIIEPSRCKRCNSAARSPYYNKTVRIIAGKRLTWRRCRCLDCHQLRVDKVIEDVTAVAEVSKKP